MCCDLGINPENFNPRILYVFKAPVNHKTDVCHHCHDYVELKYILSGTCTYRINDVIYHVKKGDVIICNPGLYHFKMLAPDEELLEFNAGINNLCIEDLPKGFLMSPDVSPVLRLSKYEQDFVKCLNSIFVEQEKHEPGCDLVLKALIMKLLVILLKDLNHGSRTPAQHQRISFESHEKSCVVDTIISFFNENYMKEISLERISKNMYLSPVYISKLFKEETGDSPINYLIKVRLAKAKEMLEKGEMSVKNVAKCVGYDDAYYFSKLFKKYYGSPPSRLGAG